MLPRFQGFIDLFDPGGLEISVLIIHYCSTLYIRHKRVRQQHMVKH